MTEEKAPSKLHWPGWIWVVGNIILMTVVIAGSIIGFFQTAGIRYSLASYLDSSIFLLIRVSFLVSAIGMLINRKIGWFIALVSIACAIIDDSIRFIRYLTPGEPYSTTPINSWTWFFGYLTLNIGLSIAWAIYFILARRRYGIGRRVEN